MGPNDDRTGRDAVAPGGQHEGLGGQDGVSASARGWHTIQLAVLGFIGICGVLRTADSPAPRAVQWVAAALAVAALAAACLAVFTVGRVAYPIGPPGEAGTRAATARLRTGIRLTVAALILAVIAALSGWWPAAPGGGGAVAITSSQGGAWCGPVVAGPAGAISVRSSAGVVSVPAGAIADIHPVTGCP